MIYFLPSPFITPSLSQIPYLRTLGAEDGGVWFGQLRQLRRLGGVAQCVRIHCSSV